MKILGPLLRNAREPQLPKHPNFPFQELLPLQLKNQVSAKGEKVPSTACIQEMAVMFACVKKHEFNEAACTTEIELFTQCFNKHMDAKKAAKALRKSGESDPGAKQLSPTQLNQLLKKYPQYNETRHKIRFK